MPPLRSRQAVAAQVHRYLCRSAIVLAAVRAPLSATTGPVSEASRWAPPGAARGASAPGELQTGGGPDHRRSSRVDGVDDLRVIDPLQVDRGDPEMGMPKLALDDRQGDPFVRHLDRVRVAELVWREPTPHSRCGGDPAQLTTRGCRLPVAPGGRAVDHAEQRADRELDAELLPGLEVLPRRAVDPTSRRLSPYVAPGTMLRAGAGRRRGLKCCPWFGGSLP
jgi:hypothetical protein